MRYGGRREIRIAAGILAVLAVQLVWYWAVVLSLHMLYADRPVRKDLGFGILTYTVLYLPLLLTLVLAVIVGARRLLRRGR